MRWPLEQSLPGGCPSPHSTSSSPPEHIVEPSAPGTEGAGGHFGDALTLMICVGWAGRMLLMDGPWLDFSPP